MGLKIAISFSLAALVLFLTTTSHAGIIGPGQCGEDEIFDQCGRSCEPTCIDPKPSCLTHVCLPPSCQCKEGAVRNSGGNCVLLAQCANDEILV